MRHLAFIALFAAAACGPGNVGPGDGDGGMVDGNSAMGGLILRFHAPQVDEAVDGVTVDRIRGKLRDLRALGDAAPGDERTSRDALDLHLDDHEENADPAHRVVEFTQAPPGRYSSFEFVFDARADGEDAWFVEGSVVIESESWDFRIEDEDASTIGLALDDVLILPGETTTITIDVDVVHICEGIAWEAPEGSDDEIEIDGDSAEIAGIRSRFATAFSVSEVEVE